MRTWCYEHPTATWAAAFGWYLLLCWMMVDFATDGGWWWLASLLCFASACKQLDALKKWWRLS